MKAAATMLYSKPPEGWRVGRLDEYAQVQMGRQRSPKNHNGPFMRPYLRAANVTWRGLALDDVKMMNFSPEDADRFRLSPGDLVLAEGSGSPNEVGKPALWRGEIEDCCFQNTLIRVRGRGEVDPRFLLYLFTFEALSGHFGTASRGVNLHHLGSTTLAAWPIGVPDIKEQQRIVEVIEEQFSRLEAGVLSLQRAKRSLSHFRRSLLMSAIAGRLLDASLASGWRWSTVGEVGAVDLGRQRSPKYHQGPNMRPYLRVANVFENRLKLDDVMWMDFSDDQYKKYKLEVGDILLNEGQSPELVGRPAMYRGELPGVCFTNSLIRFRPFDGIDREFALLVFRAHLWSGRFAREARITTNIAHLSASRFKTVEFPVPPLGEQLRIVAEVERQSSIIDAMGKTIDAGLRRADTLRQSILRQAFSGRLAGAKDSGSA